MIGISIALMNEFMDGSLLRILMEKPYGPYSNSWFRKTFNGEKPINYKKIREKVLNHYLNIFPEYQCENSQNIVSKKTKEEIPPTELNIEYFHSILKSEAPLAMHLNRDIFHLLDIEDQKNEKWKSESHLNLFPYQYWWKISEFEGNITLEMAVDACIAFFTCFLIDAELSIDVETVIDQILLSDVHIKYNPLHATSSYVNFKAERIKGHPEFTLQDFYRHCANAERHGDSEIVEKRIKGWRNKKKPVKPNLELFGDFVYYFGGISERRMWTEFETVGLFLAVQLIQKYRSQPTGDSELLRSDNFYRDRVHFWYERLTEHYSEVLVRRKAEIDKEKSGLS